MGLLFGTLIALVFLIAPGAIIARIAQASWPVAVAVGPPLTYGVAALAVIPYGALGIPWNGWTALAALAGVGALTIVLQASLARDRRATQPPWTIGRWPGAVVAAGVVLGALLIGWAAYRGIGQQWQSIPSTWDSVWHANTVRFILDTGQASSTHMGELRNVETHASLYYPSVFHSLVAVFCQLTGAAPTTGYTLSAVAASVWLFPTSAAVLTWQVLRTRASSASPAGSTSSTATTPMSVSSTSPAGSTSSTSGQWLAAGAAATAAALSASFTAVPYVEFGTAAVPNLVAYGISVPTMALITTTLRHRYHIPLAVLALVGVFSVHLTGGFVVILFLLAWWLLEALRHPVRSRAADAVSLAAVVAPAGLILAPQFMGVLRQANIIAGHAFPSSKSTKQDVIDAIFQHTRHLNDFPTQYALVALATIGMGILLHKKVWWLPALWLWLIVAIVSSEAPFTGPVGRSIEQFTQFFYNDPRRLSAVATMLLAPMAGIGLFAAAVVLVAWVARLTNQSKPLSRPVWATATAMLLVVATALTARHYLWRHLVLFGDKYDSVMIDQKDLDAMAYLATLPDARNTVIGNANTDGTAWMYAIAGLHPLWTHYDYPMQQGPGYHRFIFWAYARKGDADPQVVEAVRLLNIRYILTSVPTVQGFAVPDGLVSLEKSPSWAKIYDNGEARIYEWRGTSAARHS